MARSTYVYVVHDPITPRRPTPTVVATFTVKHELVSWLTQHPECAGYLVYRFRDGHPEQPAVTMGCGANLMTEDA